MYIDTSLFFIQNSSFISNYTPKGANIGYFVSGGSGGNGGGIYVNRSASPSMITNCLFQENHTGDGITIGNQFEHGVLSGANGGHGGGIYIGKSTPVLLIIGCIFKSNYCGNSVIPSDMASQPNFYLFPDGGSGGAVCNAGSNVQIINSTIAGNYCGTATIYNGDSLNLVPADSVRGKGGGLYGVNEVTNSIIAENSIGNEFQNELEGTGNVNYSLITNDTLAEFSGIGNLINVTPGFLNFPADLSLAQNSLAINHGSPDTTGLFLPETDMAGNPRINGDRIDMGAYEFQGEPEDQYAVSTDLIRMDSIFVGSYSIDSLTIFNYGSKSLIIDAETAPPFSLSLDKTGWNTSLPGITIPEGLPVSPRVIYMKFESLSAGDFQNVITMNTENSSCLVSINGYCKSTEGIFNENDELNLSVVPNPFRNETRINYFIEKQGDVSITLFNSSGIRINGIELPSQQKGMNSYLYQDHSMKPGIYFLELTSGNARTTVKVVKVRATEK